MKIDAHGENRRSKGCKHEWWSGAAPPLNLDTAKSETHRRETPHGQEKKKINSYLNKNNRLFPAHCSLLKLHRPPSLRKDLLLISRKSLQCNNVLSSFFCREWLLSRLPASLTDCLWLKMSICPIMCAVSCFPLFLLLPALCLIYIYIFFLHSGGGT